MARIPLNFGTVADDGTGDTNRQLWSNTDANFQEIYLKSVPDNVITVNQLSDFPTPVGGIITLNIANTQWFLGADIALGANVLDITAAGTSIVSTAPGGAVLSTTSSSDMITLSNSGIFTTNNVIYSCPNSPILIKGTATTQNILIFNTLILDCQTVVQVNNSGFSLVMSVIGVLECDIGVDLQSNTTTLSFDRVRFISTNAAFVGISLNTFTVDNFEYINFLMSAPLGGKLITGLVNSGNITADNIAVFRDGTTTGGMEANPLQNITQSDIRWEFRDNGGLEDSSKTMDTFLTASRTVTIAVAGTFVAVNGTDWSSDVTERFTSTNAGLATYTSEQDSKSLVVATAAVEKVGGGADEIELAIFINGSISNKTISLTENATPTTVVSQGVFTLSENDTIQIFVANIDSTADIIVSRATMTIINGF